MAPDSGLVFLTKERQLPMPRWWIEDFLVEGSVTMFSAQPKAGKSAFAAQLAYAVATGTHFFERRVDTGTVLYLAGERGHQTEDRLLHLFGDQEPVNTALLLLKRGTACDIKFNRDGDPERLVETLTTNGISPALMIVDTLSNFFEGDQNSESDMGDFFDGVRWVSDHFSAAALVLHHDNKEYVDRYNRRSGGSSYRGSGAALGRVDAYMRARVVNELPDSENPRSERTVKIVEIELAEDNWGGAFRQTVAVRKLLEDPAGYLKGASVSEAMDELVIEVIERCGTVSVTALEDAINSMKDPRMRGRRFTRKLLRQARARLGDRIIECTDPDDGRATLLAINPVIPPRVT